MEPHLEIKLPLVGNERTLSVASCLCLAGLRGNAAVDRATDGREGSDGVLSGMSKAHVRLRTAPKSTTPCGLNGDEMYRPSVTLHDLVNIEVFMVLFRAYWLADTKMNSFEGYRRASSCGLSCRHHGPC